MHGDDFLPHPTLAPFAQRQEQMFYYRAGRGKTLVLLHGNGDEADTWRNIFLPLAQHFDVIAPDLPGFGRSGADATGGSLENMVTSLMCLFNNLKVQNFSVLGSSMGAVVAAMIAAQEKNRINNLVLMAGAAPCLGGLAPSTELQALLTPGVGEKYYNNLRQENIEAAFLTLEPYYANLAVLPSNEQIFLRNRVWARVWSNTQRDAFFAGLRSMFRPRETLTNNISMPTLLVWGEADKIVPASVALVLKQQLQNAQLVTVPNCGHLPQQEQAPALLAVLYNFLGAA